MTLDKMHDMFFGPLDKSYCNLFLFFAILGLVALILTVFGILFQLLMAKKKSFAPITWFYALVGPLILYLQNRLLYGMCLN